MADGEILYEVRASLDKLREDLLAAQEESKKGGSKLADIAAGTAKAIGAGFAAAGKGIGAVGEMAVNSAAEMDSAINSFSAATGYSSRDLERFQDVMESIYANNYGESFQDISDSMATVSQTLGGMPDDQLQALTESALTLRDTFEYDVAESTRAAKAMMDNFGISGDEAMSMIAAGAQNGLDYSGELIDSISEYSVQFAKVGLDADDMFNIFHKGAESGAFNLDKVGDAVKEFSIRAIDGSDSTAEGFKKLGLNADDMAAKFAAGGNTAKQAFQDTINALADMEDPIEQNTAGVDLFGTMWEDLGPEAVTALTDIEDVAYDTYDALNGIREVKYDDLGSMLEGLKRSVEMLVVPLGEALIPFLQQMIGEVLPVLQEMLPPLLESFMGFLPALIQIAQELLPVILDVITQLMPFFSQMIEEIMPLLIELIGELLPPIMEIVQTILPPLMGLMSTLLPVIAELISTLLPPLVDIFNILLEPITTLISALLPPLNELFSAIKPLIEALMPVIEALASVFSEVLGGAIDLVMPIIESIMDILGKVIDFITNVFEGNWEDAWNGIVDIFKSIFNLIPQIAESIINGAIGIINKLIDGINNITDHVGIPAIPSIPEVSLPRFHTGGIIDFEGRYEAPILAKDGEMVLTKSQQKQLFDIANGSFSQAQWLSDIISSMPDVDIPASGAESITDNSSMNVTIKHENHFTVRRDSDIDSISEKLSQREIRDLMALGKDKK